MWLANRSFSSAKVFGLQSLSGPQVFALNMAFERDYSSERMSLGCSATKVDGWMSYSRPQSRDDTWLSFALVDVWTRKSYDFINLLNSTRPGLHVACLC